MTVPTPRSGPDGLHIRHAVRSDFARLTEIRAQRGVALEEARTWAERNVARAEDPELDCVLFVAEHEGLVVAYGVAAHFEPPPDAPANCALAGDYLVGLGVDIAHRRRGIATALVRRRLEWIAGRADTAYYFADDDNAASIALHDRFGFEPVMRGIWFPGLQSPDEPMTLYHAPAVERA